MTDAAGVAFANLPSSCFQPLVFSAFGQVHESTKTFLKLLVSHSSRASGYSYNSAAQYVYDYLFCALAKANASMLVLRYQRDPLHADPT
jgi:hypothetical protein